MVGAARINDTPDLRMRGEEIGDLGRAFRLLTHPDRQRFKALQQRPCVERRQAGSGVSEIVVQVLIDPLLVRQDDAAKAAALAVDVLGGGIDDDMRAEFERLLLQRRGEDIVDDKPRAGLVGEFRHRSDVDYFQRRIGRAFEEEQFCVGANCLFPIAYVGTVDQRRFDAVFRRQRLDYPAAGTE